MTTYGNEPLTIEDFDNYVRNGNNDGREFKDDAILAPPILLQKIKKQFLEVRTENEYRYKKKFVGQDVGDYFSIKRRVSRAMIAGNGVIDCITLFEFPMVLEIERTFNNLDCIDEIVILRDAFINRPYITFTLCFKKFTKEYINDQEGDQSLT